jgi:lysyl-tRNA synthetase class 2
VYEVKFSIKKEIFEKFPDLCLGALSAQGLDNRSSSDEITHLIQAAEAEIRNNFNRENLSQEPRIRSWRAAYREFGAKPKKHLSSVESLYRWILSGKDWRPINKIVDIYNLISIKHMIPLGGDDLSKTEGDITLKIAKGGESFTPLNSDMTETARPDEVIYMDDKNVLCRRWNWRECDKTKMTVDTQDVLIVAEGLLPVSKKEISAAVEELERLTKTFCGGKTQTFILDKSHTEIQV